MSTNRAIRSIIILQLAAGSLLLPYAAARADVVASDAAAAAAADANAAPTGAESSPKGLQEIVVTATRHEESLSKVPISVTALSQDAMDARGIKDFQDIARFTPGVSIDNSGTNAISIRGISSSAGAGTTGIYLDDTPIQMRDAGFNPDDTLPKTFDLDRVEILRGPQGTLFGSGSEGGTVRYIMTQPSLTTASTYVRTEASYTEYGQPSYEFGIAHGGPIIDGTLGFRASAWYRYDGGWIDRVSDNSDPADPTVIAHNVNYAHTLVLRLAGIWQPVNSFTVTPSVMYQNRQEHDQPTYWPAYSNPGAGDFNTATPERIPDPDKYYLPALKLEYDLDKSALISNSSYYHRDEFTGYQGTVYDLGFFQSLGWPTNPLTGGLGCEATGVAANCPWYPLLNGSGIHLPPQFADYQTPNVMTNTQQSITQEIRWQSTDNNSKLRWTVGAFWQLAKEQSIEELKDPLNQTNALFNYLFGEPATSIFTFTNPAGATVVPFSCPTAAAYPYIPACDIYYNRNTTYDHQFAGFGELSYAFTDQWRLTVGERVARTSFEIVNYADGLENYGPTPQANGNSVPGLGRSASTHETPNTPKANLAFQMDPNNLFYVGYAKGFRVGGGNPALPPYCDQNLTQEGFPNGAPLTYKSDSTQNYEIGSKNAFGQVLRIATSVYYIKWNDIQQNVYVAGDCGLQFTDNLGTAVAKGFDIQAEVNLGSLHIDIAAGYTNARYTKNSPIVNAQGQPLAEAGDAISGQAAIDSAPGLNPPWTVALGPEYRFTIGQHDAFVRVDWEFESRNPWLSVLQDPRTSQYFPYTYTLSSTTFTSLRGGITLGSWLVTPFIDNLMNSHTVTNYALGAVDPYNPAGSPTVQQNQYTFRPRTFGITATWRTGPGG
jgi:outer membrane receptor protein involved in Fe transport